MISINNKFTNKRILISGNGSWSQELVKQILLFNPLSITTFSRNELKIVELQRVKNNPSHTIVIGDVTDEKRMFELTKNIDIVIHTSALKHLPICEDFMNDAINTNIIGTQILLRQAELNNVKEFIFIGTDKAVNPSNMYGATKAVCERLVVGHKGNMKTTAIRSGNVIGSQGSVIPFWEACAKNNKVIKITNPQMTRYFLTLPQAISLVLKAVESSVGKEIYVLKMRAANIFELANVISDEYKTEFNYEITGIRPGEKIHEQLVSEHEAPNTVIDNEFRIILPVDGSLNDYYKNYKRMYEKEYNSSQELMNKEEIKNILQLAGYLKKWE